MKFTLILTIVGAAFAAPQYKRQTQPCFLTGPNTLPSEVLEVATSLASTITCSATLKTISNVPDVSSNGISFSSINFADSDQSPLSFALGQFATISPLRNNDLARFQDELNVYLATEAGIRSQGGSLAIKVPKFFLQFQIARIQRAQGIVSEDPAMTVEHQLEKVLKNAGGERQDVIDEVNNLAITFD